MTPAAKRRRRGTHSFVGYWLTLERKRVERIHQNEWPEIYRLYDLGTRLGLTDVSVAGQTADKSAPLRQHPAYTGEANPFH